MALTLRDVIEDWVGRQRDDPTPIIDLLTKSRAEQIVVLKAHAAVMAAERRQVLASIDAQTAAAKAQATTEAAQLDAI